MSDKPVLVTSRINMGGTWYGVEDVKRGQTFAVPTKDEADKVVALGYADYGKVKAEDLGRAYQEDPEALQAHAQRIAASVPEEQRPVRGPINIRRGGRLV
jgi:hypothetical protein